MICPPIWRALRFPSLEGLKRLGRWGERLECMCLKVSVNTWLLIPVQSVPVGWSAGPRCPLRPSLYDLRATNGIVFNQNGVSAHCSSSSQVWNRAVTWISCRTTGFTSHRRELPWTLSAQPYFNPQTENDTQIWSLALYLRSKVHAANNQITHQVHRHFLQCKLQCVLALSFCFCNRTPKLVDLY